MTDLTIIYMTANRMPETWVKYHREHLLSATAGYRIISISRQPIDIGENIVEAEQPGYANIYRQLLNGARLATTTYVAMAEDDVLYSRSHFDEYRPKLNEVAYNRSRWSVFAWDDSVFSLRNRVSNCTLIAPREYLIDALEERFRRHPDPDSINEGLWGEVGRSNIESGLGVSRRKAVEWYSWCPVVQVSHESGTEERQQRKRKRHAQVRAYDIPYWGKPSDILQHLKGEQ